VPLFTELPVRHIPGNAVIAVSGYAEVIKQMGAYSEEK
jgi:hypothetical protein